MSDCTESVEVLSWASLTLEELYSMSLEQWATLAFTVTRYKGDVAQGRAVQGEVFQAGAYQGNAVSGVNE